MTFEARASRLFAALTKGEASALEICDRLETKMEPLPRLSGGQVAGVYSDLRQLEAQGRLLVRQTDPLPERGGRPRFYYRLPWKVQR